MKVKDMIRENNRLREQLTPFNRSYFEDVIIGLRASRVEPQRTEELLLEAVQLLLREQGKGRNAKQVFGENPGDYFKEVIDSVPVLPARSRLNYYLMLPWAALTGLFGVLAAAGLLVQSIEGDAGVFGQISLFTLIAVAAGSIVLFQLMMKWMASLSDEEAPRFKRFDLKGLGIYILIAVIAVFAGIFLDSIFPVITLSPWVSLILFLIGTAGLKFLFFRK
ncbi:DUF1129 family protein [Paenibacillus donghaensis]|nr:DUF1129 family protein [Paenibacillus donghaensis]